MTPPPPVLLVVEDSPEDVEALLRAFRKAGVTRSAVLCPTADEALDYLQRAADNAVTWPELVLLDLNLPGTDGRDLLVALRAGERTRSLPVLVLTSSTNPRDIDFCYAHGANAYMVKPMGIESMHRLVTCFSTYWLGPWVRLPDASGVGAA